MNRVLKHRTTWHLINIKARRNQTTEHYIEVFRSLYSQDPMVMLPREKSSSLKSMSFSEILDEEGNLTWIRATLLYYTIIDSTAFYNKREQEDIDIEDWDSDIVANKKEVELYFIPSVHTLAVRANSKITLKNIERYLKEALERVAPDMFDVDVIVERDILDKIINAYAVTKLEASISYSNPGHTNGFQAAFDTKLREMGGSRTEFKVSGSREHPLGNEEDGMLHAIVNLSEHNGNVRATIQASENSNLEVINSSEHPKILVIPQIVNDICSTIYDAVRNIFNN